MQSRIVLAGIVGRYPFGGVTWCSLMYLLGLKALGCDVYYLEDTGESNYDPQANALANDPSYATTLIHSTLRRHGLGEKWCYIDVAGTYHGLSRAALVEVCESADIFLNLSGGCWFWRPEYERIPVRAFIDSDPAFTQYAIDDGPEWYREFFQRFTHHFTFGSAIGSESCSVPLGGFHWIPTWQPIVLTEWDTKAAPTVHAYTTIMTWKIESFADIGGNKDEEFLKIIDLPNLVDVQLAPAINGPIELLLRHGWKCQPALPLSLDVDRYRGFVQASRAEFSIAKHRYVASGSGWFSDRSECYLASGRPVVVQDTGFSKCLPVGAGIVPFSTKEEARRGIEAVESRYGFHARSARDIAREYFASDVVLERLLGHCASMR